MKRPEKKELSNEGNRCVQVGEDYIVGYNQSCDDWEKWTEKCQEDFISVSSLPSCKELEEIIDTFVGVKPLFDIQLIIIKSKPFNKITMNKDGRKTLAQAIHKRLRGER